MNIGIVIGICTQRLGNQELSLNSIVKFSRPETEKIAVFNGINPFPLGGFEILKFPERMSQEQGLWKKAFGIAVERNWDWCFLVHDDFELLGGGIRRRFGKCSE